MASSSDPVNKDAESLSPPTVASDTHADSTIQAGKAGTSIVWQFFKKYEHDAGTFRAACNICSTTLSLGGKSAKTQGTSSLYSHLKYKHPKELTSR